MRYPTHIQHLIAHFRQLPGVGGRTAERYVFHLLNWAPEQMEQMAETIRATPEKLVPCTTCGCILDEGECEICNDSNRDPAILCVLSSPRDLYAVEQTGQFRGLYHVITGLLSPLEGRSPEELGLLNLKARVENHGVQEVVLAFDSTADGDATALYIKELLGTLGVAISRPAYGMPMGSPLEYIDEGTLACALSGRRRL
jgi:recombination protein RecR